MLLKMEMTEAQGYLLEHTGFILIKLNEREYKRKLYSKTICNDSRYIFRLNNKRYIVPFNLDHCWNYIHVDQLLEA